MARYGIPSYRVPLDVIDQEVAEVEKLGVEFRFNTRIEKVDDLFAQGYRCGLHRHRRPGRRHARHSRRRPAQRGRQPDLPARRDAGPDRRRREPAIVIGKRVAVIGGGNVATDNAAPRAASAPKWWTWSIAAPARKCRRATTRSRAASRRGVNLRFLLAPKKIELNDSRQFAPEDHLRRRCNSASRMPPAAAARWRSPAASSPRTSIWSSPPSASVRRSSKASACRPTKNGRIQVREDSMLTSRPGVYAGGDCVLGPSTLIESVAQGRKAAAAMDAFLGGDGDIEEKLLPRLGHRSAHRPRGGLQHRTSACIRSSSTRPSATTGTRSNSASTRRPPGPRRCAA